MSKNNAAIIEYRQGVENIPLQNVIKSTPALVLVYNLLNEDEIILEKRIDFGKFEDRQWIGRITAWALANHHSIETMALCDAEPPMKENK